MSFGVGVGDILKVGELAYKVWKTCSGASTEFKELDRELSSIQITLRSLADDANEPTSIICRRGAARKDELMLIVSNLELALVAVERLVNKYQSLGLVKKRTFDRAKFATHDLNDIRQKLAIHLAALNSFYNSLSTSSLARIEAVLEDLYQDIRNGDREPTVISMCNDPEDESAWTLLEKELTFEGIEVNELNKYRSDVVAFLRTLISKDTEGLDPSDSVSNDPSSSRSAISDLLCMEKLRLHDFHVDHNDAEEDDREAALRWAAEDNHVDLVHYLLRNNVDIDACDNTGATALHGAARMGHFEVVKALIDNKANINALRRSQSIVPNEARFTYRRDFNFGRPNVRVRKSSLTIMMEAAQCGKTSIVRLLIEHGAILGAFGNDSATPLHLAVENGHIYTSRVLIEAGSDLEANYLPHDDRTVLCVAAEAGNAKLLKMLLSKGANPMKTWRERGTMLNIVLKSKVSEESKLAMCHLLIDAGVRVSPAKIQNSPVAPLNLAILQGKEKLVDFLLKRGADPDFVDSSGQPPLYHALKLAAGTKGSSITITKRLLQAEADCKWRRAEDDCSYLHIAASLGNHEAMQLMLDQGIGVNDLDRFGTNALHFATSAGAIECVTILLQKAIDTKQVSKLQVNSYYARDIAILKGNAEIIGLLASRSPTMTLRTQRNRYSDKDEVWSYADARSDHLANLKKGT